MEISYSKFISNLTQNSKNQENDIVFFASSEEDAISSHKLIKFLLPSEEVLFFPSLDCLAYDRISPSARISSERAYILTKLCSNNSRKILITNTINLFQKYPKPEYFKNSFLKIQTGQKIEDSELERFLIDNGYTKTSCAIEPGEFSKRGDIIDVVLYSGNSYRINFEWDKIFQIKEFDPETQISKQKVDSIELFKASELTLNEDLIENFKGEYLTEFGIGKASEQFFEKIANGIKFSGAESILGAFFKEHAFLLDYLNSPQIYSSYLVQNAMNEYASDFEDFYEARINSNKKGMNFYPAFSPDHLVFDLNYITKKISTKIDVGNFSNNDENIIPNFYADSSIVEAKKTSCELLSEFSKNNKNKIILVTASSESNIARLKTLFEFNNIEFFRIMGISDAKKNVINIANITTQRSFYVDDYIIISDKDILGDKKTVAQSSRKRLKNIFKELENFSEGDLVVHLDHGIGRYETIEHLEVDGIKHDCLKLVYAKGDKLYIPVENIHLIKRYGDNEAELDYLGSVSWQKRRSKLKERIGELAEKLINLAAKRKLITANEIHFNREEYDRFCKYFPFSETEDQLKAAEDIIADLSSGKAMDRLICGDVGFGKTEIAMRAAALVALDKISPRQVVLIAPTTILARQHYNNFLERFKNFNVRIKQVSRFVKPNELAKIREEISRGEVDIIVGTHALLSDGVKFNNLGLVIVDEEQHFGVAQKEKLKMLKESDHTLTLSATPIPRTLQMSLIGIRDLSLIATAPIDRLSVRTSVTEFDDVIIRDALLREKYRGGKSFFVAPRVSDLSELKSTLENIVPELKVRVAHGQLAPSTIDEIMTEFYEGNFDVLLSTAIVESGLDIPSANTMIIYKAEMFGLSQLYQLRGRVGRGKIRGYAYLVMSNKKMPTKSAIKRLEIMQSLESLGAGFSIASHDMDIRGFGNLVGDEQSGHIKEVGVELYEDMLEEALLKLKNEPSNNISDIPDINLKVPVYIPDEYIDDESLRLWIYRRIGDIREAEEVEAFKDELTDRFGPVPDSANNLLEILKLKFASKKLSIKSMDAGTNGFNIVFNDNADSNMIMNFVSKHQTNTKIKPGNKLVYIKNLKDKDLILEAFELLRKLSSF